MLHFERIVTATNLIGNRMIFSPVVVFAFVIATLIGAVFHFIFGGDARRLALFLIASWVGFMFGHVAGQTFGIGIYKVGTLYLVMAIVGSVIAEILVLLFTAGRSN